MFVLAQTIARHPPQCEFGYAHTHIKIIVFPIVFNDFEYKTLKTYS